MKNTGTTRRIRVPVRCVDGTWEFSLGGRVPVEHGTLGELVIDAASVTDPAFLHAMDGTVKHRVIGEGATFLVALTIKPEAPPSAELAPFLRSFREVAPKMATRLLEPYNPVTQYFVEVALTKPSKHQLKKYNNSEGGLWLVTQGLKTTAIESSRVNLPLPVSKKPATSLNHALTILSETYERWRISHTGNVYTRVLYQARDGRWYPLDVLRTLTLENQEQAIAGHLWEEFMKKMTALRDAPKGK